MKFELSFLFTILTLSIYGQDIKTYNRNLILAYNKIDSYSRQNDKTKFSVDYIDNCNKDFEKLLLNYTSSEPKTLLFKFIDLEKKGLKISTSQDGLFRIYSWDTESGGTMRSFKNVFQYKGNKKVFSQNLLSDNDEYGESEFTYEILDQLISKKKTYYIVKCVFIGSSALSYHKIKLFSIEKDKLNENAQLIKTKSGIKNEIGYEIDFSSNVNQKSDSVDMEYAWLKYDKKSKTILIPLITAEGKLTKKKIKYQFKGEYFEKI